MSAWTRRFAARVISLAIIENVLLVGAVMLSGWIRFGADDWSQFSANHGYIKSWIIALVVQWCLYVSDLYDSRVYTDLSELFIRLVQGLAAASICLALLYFWFPGLLIGRGIFLIAAVLIALVVGGWRIVDHWAGWQSRPRERLLLVGTGEQAISLAREFFEQRIELGIEIVGFIDPDPPKHGTPPIDSGIVGTIEDIPSIATARGVNRIVVSLTDARGKLPMNTLLKMKMAGVQFDHLASVYEEYTGKISLENLRPSWLLFSAGFRHTRWLIAWKRTFDIVASAIGLVIGLPLMLIVAAVLKLTSEGSVLYHQTRVGLQGRPFTLHKFRTMRLDAESTTGAVWATPNDARVTRVGRFLRLSRLDEMPQLWNVLVGDMSLVGPRPERPEFVESLAASIAYYGERHVVKPGLTGWAQVRYKYGASQKDALEKLQYDLFYVKNMSVALDLLILFKTVKIVILRRGAA